MGCCGFSTIVGKMTRCSASGEAYGAIGEAVNIVVGKGTKW